MKQKVSINLSMESFVFTYLGEPKRKCKQKRNK